MSESNEPLSERELEILKLVATGAANKEIARQLLISPNTVKVHLRNIFVKIGVTSRTEATLYAIQNGLITPGGQPPQLAIDVLEEPLDEVETLGGQTSQRNTADLSDTAGSFGNGHEKAGTARQPRFTPIQIGMIALAVLLLISTGVLASRWLSPSAGPISSPVNLLAVTATPSTRWSSKAELPSARKGMGAVEYSNAFYLIGGETGDGPDGSLQRYSPVDDEWQTLAPKPVPVSDIQAALIGERIYVPGGRLADGSASKVFEVYDPRSNTWDQLAELPTPVSAYALAAFEGRLYLFGGKNGEQYLDSVYEYLPDQDRWQARTPMKTALAYAGAAAVGNRIFIVGGYDGQQALDSNLAYRPARDASGEDPWESFAAMPTGRYAMAITTLSNVIYIAGGQQDVKTPALPVTLQYFQQTDQWAIFDSPAITLGSHAIMLSSEGFLHFIGGEEGQELVTVHQVFQALFYNAIPIIQKDN